MTINWQPLFTKKNQIFLILLMYCIVVRLKNIKNSRKYYIRIDPYRDSLYKKVDSSKMVGSRDVIEYPLAMLWRHRRAFTRKLTGWETIILITRTILKLNSWDFLRTTIILLLKLLMLSNNSLMVTVLSVRRSKDRKNSFVINLMWK